MAESRKAHKKTLISHKQKLKLFRFLSLLYIYEKCFLPLFCLLSNPIFHFYFKIRKLCATSIPITYRPDQAIVYLWCPFTLFSYEKQFLQ